MTHTHTKPRTRQRRRACTCPKCSPKRRTNKRRKESKMKNGTILVVWAVATVVITILCVRIKPDIDRTSMAIVSAGAAMLPAGFVAHLWPSKKKRTSA